MLKFKIITFFTAFIIVEAKCQNYTGEREKIYKTIIEQVNNTKPKRSISKSTDIKFITDFGFKYGGKTLSDDNSLPSNSTEWINFVKSIDTSRLSNYKVNVKGKRKSFIQLTFSPIMFSNDGSMALCLGKHVYTNGTGGEQAWYLKKFDGKWKIIETYVYAIFD
ncbi:hypothetical protein ACQKCH_08720 [Nubsella zeaxanthinifaciens]|uniref:hypothetical protein n=1 Tax=Nubsella zeaxanthinifaciens TaxID=392412 RepID=UPI003D05A9C9